MEGDVQDLQPQLGVALGIPQNTKYPQKILPEGTSTLWNNLELTCSLVDDSFVASEHSLRFSSHC